MTLSVNGKRLLTFVCTEGLSGAWVQDIEVDSEEDLGKSLTLDYGKDSVFSGTVVRGGVFQGRYIARVVGGKGGLSIDAPSHYYDAVPVSTVLADLMTDSGEEIDGTIAPAILRTSLTRWLRPVGPPWMALDDIARKLDLTWRVTRAGKIWLGEETWPELPDDVAQVLTRGPSSATVSVAPTPEAPVVRPGVTFLGKRVSRVATTLQGGKLRQDVWLDEGRGDRLLDVLRALVNRFLGRRLTYLGQYPATVVRQSGDGLSLEVVPDDEEVRGDGLTRVPILHGSPGWGVRVPKGTRIRLSFDGGDPSRPKVAAWEPGAVDSISVAGGTRGAGRMGDAVTSTLTPKNVVDLAACFTVPIPTPGGPVPLSALLNPAIISAALVPGSPLVPPISVPGVISVASTKFFPG